MNKKLALTIASGFIFATGIVCGMRIEKKYKSNRTKYAGTLEVILTDDVPDIYLALAVPIDELVGSSEVIFKVHMVETK